MEKSFKFSKSLEDIIDENQSVSESSSLINPTSQGLLDLISAYKRNDLEIGIIVLPENGRLDIYKISKKRLQEYLQLESLYQRSKKVDHQYYNTITCERCKTNIVANSNNLLCTSCYIDVYGIDQADC